MDINHPAARMEFHNTSDSSNEEKIMTNDYILVA
jgi:hypothetical protein